MLTKIVKYYRVQYLTPFTIWSTISTGLDKFEQAKEVCNTWKNRHPRLEYTLRIVEITITKIYADPCNTEVQTEEITQERYLYVNKDYT